MAMPRSASNSGTWFVQPSRSGGARRDADGLLFMQNFSRSIVGCFGGQAGGWEGGATCRVIPGFETGGLSRSQVATRLGCAISSPSTCRTAALTANNNNNNDNNDNENYYPRLPPHCARDVAIDPQTAGSGDFVPWNSGACCAILPTSVATALHLAASPPVVLLPLLFRRIRQPQRSHVWTADPCS